MNLLIRLVQIRNRNPLNAYNLPAIPVSFLGVLAMKCRKCKGNLEILRMCGKIRMQCKDCRHEYQIHEVADQLDPETEKILEHYPSIIYG
jgi:hypothetical protein